MRQTGKARLDSLMADLEDLWAKVDEVYGSLSPGQWSRKFGKDWTFADQPYHLAYFDRLAANNIARGPDLPVEEQFLVRSMAEINAWNAKEFAKRPAGQTVQQTLEQMRASREAIRQAVANMADADLSRRAWMPILAGWVTAQDMLAGCIVHTWSEFGELRFRLGRKAPEPGPSATHISLAFFLGFLPMVVNRELAKTTRFTAVMDFTGPGGGAWTIRVADGKCTLTEERAAKADLVMTQSPDTFDRVRKQLQNPMLLTLTRKIKVRGLRKMGTFAKLFPQPTPDQVLAPGAQSMGGVG